MDSWLNPLIERFGLLGLAVDVFLEAMGLPLPGETLVVIAGGLAALGELNPFAVWLVASVAATLGDNVGYLIGRRLGRPVVLQYGSWMGITPPRFAKVEALLARHGILIVFIARFVVLLRQLNGLAAGTAQMPWSRFVLANAAGAMVWVGVWVTLGFTLGPRAHDLLPQLWHHLSRFGGILIPALFFMLIALFWLRRRKRAQGGS